jgi:oligoendopeptidase F
MRSIFTTLASLIIVISPAGAGLAADPTPATSWDLTEMFPDADSLATERQAVADRIPELAQCRGTLGDSKERLRQCLELRTELRKDYAKLAIYGGLNADRDLRDAGGQRLRAEIQRLGVELTTAASWIDPEILDIGTPTIEEFLAAEPGLAPYAFPLRDTLRQADHTLPADQEALLSRVGLISGKFSDVYRQLTTSDMPYPTVDLVGVGEILLNQASYVRYRGSDDRSTRAAVFETFWETFAEYENTLGTLLAAEVQKNWFYAATRGYGSSVEAALAPGNIPVEVYTSLIDDVRANLPVLHRMLELRRRILGLDSLTYADIYASIVPEVDASYTWAEARPIVLGALAPLGEDYVAAVSSGWDSWVDVYPAPGKRAGAYSSGGWYDGHPWILLNWVDSFESVSTAAHEFGHAMHSRLAARHQPYPTFSYSIMSAEVASTFNEALLKEHLLAETTDPTLRMLLLGDFLERFRQTVFRQTMFAEFELAIHRRVEAGEALTGESLSAIYLDLLRAYHGHDAGVMTIDDRYRVEWAYIPHFYRGFYVYQYATGMVASTALAEKVLADGPGARDRYLGFLAGGGSDYPIQLLREAGVDLTTSEPFETAIKAVNRTMDEIEELLEEVEAKR